METSQIRVTRVAPRALGIGAALLIAGCGPSQSGPDTFRGLDASDRFTAGDSGRRIGPAGSPPPLSIDAREVTWDELTPRLAEAAGGLVVEEITLDRLLAQEMDRRGLQVSDADLESERDWLELTILEGTPRVGSASDDLVYQVRQRRGLGPIRFESLLKRNAMLRALVRERVAVREEQVQLAWRVQHAERLRVRLIVTPTEREAQAAAGRALAGDPAGLELRFTELAQELSTDPSGARGGLIEPFSPEDPAYEQAIRTTAASLQPGQIGPVVAIRNGFALLYLDERLPADGVTLDQARADLTEQLRRRQERLLMDELASQLLAEARVRVLDESLNWSVRAGQER
ncbi:MAG: peptidylprolyl isomerase [Phycisphaerales bacterium]|nr:peptidylprolyl isomerase [Phycisphaerales bacterium]